MKRKIFNGLGSPVAPRLPDFDSGLLRRRIIQDTVATVTAVDTPLTPTAPSYGWGHPYYGGYGWRHG